MQKKRTRFFSLILGVLGMTSLMVVFIPIAANEAKERQEFPDLLSPLVKENKLLTPELRAQINGDVQGTSDSTDVVDYTHATNWFPEASDDTRFASRDNVSFYTISVPKLGLEGTTVALGGEDLSNNLIQYPGTAIPGKRGNSVIFGHSILPIFFDPTNYLSVFSTIDKLEKGDKILVDYDGISYVYQVKEMFRVKPTDVWILNQESNSANLSLVTCWPMGHPNKPERLVVKAELVK